jgi:hypothetical protein
VLKHFQERMPYGLFVPDVPRGTFGAPTVFAKRSPPIVASNPYTRVPETPSPGTRNSGGVLVLANDMPQAQQITDATRSTEQAEPAALRP